MGEFSTPRITVEELAEDDLDRRPRGQTPSIADTLSSTCTWPESFRPFR